MSEPNRTEPKKYKVALLFICINEPYWPYLFQVMVDAKSKFLPMHDVDTLVWSDMPKDLQVGTHHFEVESVAWPMPTLMRYHLFLQQEELLETYDYIFYLDADMRIVDTVGDEIIGEGLTMAEHPMYASAKRFIPPYEPNKESTAYVHRLGIVTNDDKGQPWFKPLYAAGGFQGGKASLYVEAMKAMRANIDKDFHNNYTAIWNDESHWNKYLFDYKGHLTVLTPSFVYPDSLIKEYYEPIWGRSYHPKIITLTKPFTTSKEGGDAVREMLGGVGAPSTIKPLPFICPTCNSQLVYEGVAIDKVLKCNGPNQPHEVEGRKI